MLEEVPTLTVNVPSCLLIPPAAALTNVCEPVYGEVPTLTTNVF